MCKHVAAALYGVGARFDEDPSLFFTLRGIALDDIITQTVADTAQTLLRKAEGQRANVLEDVDLGDGDVLHGQAAALVARQLQSGRVKGCTAAEEALWHFPTARAAGCKAAITRRT